jgi:hypothetical protein
MGVLGGRGMIAARVAVWTGGKALADKPPVARGGDDNGGGRGFSGAGVLDWLDGEGGGAVWCGLFGPPLDGSLQSGAEVDSGGPVQEVAGS